METPQSEAPWCPDCGTPLQQIDDRPGKEAWICPVAARGKVSKKIGKPESKHQECWIYECKSWVDSH
jgi:hypothetical protein